MAYIIRGQLLSSRNQQPLPNLRIEAFYRLQEQAILNQTTTSDSGGDFKFELSEDLFANVSQSENVDVFFQVYRDNQVLPSNGAISALQPQDYAIKIMVNVPQGNDKYRVKGTITLADGARVVGIKVRAEDRDMRPEWSQLLGETHTDVKGYYEIFYTRDQLRRAEKKTAD